MSTTIPSTHPKKKKKKNIVRTYIIANQGQYNFRPSILVLDSSSFIGPLEDQGLRRGGPVGDNGSGERVLHLLGTEGVPLAGQGVEEGCCALAVQGPHSVGPRVLQGIQQADVLLPKCRTTGCTEGLADGAPVAEDRKNGPRVRDPVAA